MKRFFLFFFSLTLLFLTSCGKATQNTKPQISANLAVNSSNVYVEPQVKKANPETLMFDFKKEVVSEGILLETPSKIAFNGSDYIFGFFGYDEYTKIADENAPTYQFGVEFAENLSYVLPYNIKSSDNEIKAIYFLKHNFYYKGFHKEGETISELDKPDIKTQTFYTTLDLLLEIPKPIFNQYSEFTLYSDREFKKEISLFFDLNEASKTLTTEPIIYALNNVEEASEPIEDFNYYEIKSYFGIDQKLNNYVLTRDNDKIIELTDKKKYERYNHGNYFALYNETLGNLFVLLLNELKVTPEDNQFLIPKDVTNIDISGKPTERIFQNQSSLKGLFLNTEAKTINITNTIDKTTDISHLFSNAKYLEEIIGLETIDTPLVNNIAYMFYNTESLTTVNLNNLDTTNVQDASHFFHNTNLNSVDLSHLNTTNLVELKYMFANTNALMTKLPHFNFKNINDLRGMFKDTINIDVLDLTNADFTSVKYYNLFLENAKLGNLILNNTTVTSVDSLFNKTITADLSLQNYSYHESIPLLNLSKEALTVGGQISLEHFYIDITSTSDPAFKDSFITNFVTSFGAKAIEIKNLSSTQNGTLNSFLKDLDESVIQFNLGDLTTWDTTSVSDFSSLFANYKTNLSNASSLTLNLNFQNATKIDKLIQNANFTGLTLDPLTTSRPTSAIDAFTAPNLDTLMIRNFDFSNTNLTLSGQVKVTNLDVETITIDFLKNLTDLTFNPNKNNMQRFLIGSVSDTNPRGESISLYNNFSFSNIKEFKLDNLKIPRIKSYHSLFKGFAYGEEAVISAREWFLDNPDLDLTSMFEGVNLFNYFGYNFQVSDNANMTCMFKNAILSRMNHYRFYLGGWGSTLNRTRKIKVKTYTNMFEGVDTGPKTLSQLQSLDVDAFDFDTTTKQTIATNMNISAFSFKVTTDNQLKLFAPILRSLIDNGILEEINVDDLTITTTDLSLFTMLPFSTMYKLDHVYFARLRFEGADTSLAYLFKDLPGIDEQFSWIDFTNVSNIDGMFSGSVIDSDLALNLKQEVSANGLFEGAIIKSSITQIVDPKDPGAVKPKLTSIDNMFKGALGLVQLHLDTFNIANPTSAKSVFKDFRFNDGDLAEYANVLKEDRIINITGWDFKNYKDNTAVVQDFFSPSAIRQNNINQLIYNNADIYSLFVLRDNMTKLTNLTPELGKNVTYWDFEYLYLHDTGRAETDVQNRFFTPFVEGDFKLDNLKLRNNLEHLYCFLEIKSSVGTHNFYKFTRTNFSTWNFDTASIDWCFNCLYTKTDYPPIFDLSNVKQQVSHVKYGGIFRGVNSTTINTSNWDMTNCDDLWGTFESTVNFTWIRNNFTGPANTPSTTTRCWRNSLYSGDVPSNFPLPTAK